MFGYMVSMTSSTIYPPFLNSTKKESKFISGTPSILICVNLAVVSVLRHEHQSDLILFILENLLSQITVLKARTRQMEITFKIFVKLCPDFKNILCHMSRSAELACSS